MSQTILLAEDHKIVREGLRSLLDQHDDLEVIGEAKDAKYWRTGGLTPDQVEFHRAWPGEIFLVRSVEEARSIVEMNRK